LGGAHDDGVTAIWGRGDNTLINKRNKSIEKKKSARMAGDEKEIAILF
jgi:hypothetical protein